VANKEEYLRLFLPLFLQGLVDVEELLDHQSGEMFYAIQVFNACAYLLSETGECSIQDKKPEACKKAKVGHFRTCVK
jgi:Fe-S-cluster containining protein